MAETGKLSEKTVRILRLISDGYSYNQIVDGHSDISFRDIFDAAKEALYLNDSSSAYEERMAEMKQRYPRAYERWTEKEDADLEAMRGQGVPLDELVARFQRQPSAIRSRLEKLTLKDRRER